MERRRPASLKVLVALAASAAIACGGPRVQQATVRAPSSATDPRPRERTEGEPGAAPAPAVAADAPRWIVTPAHTRLEIHGWGPIVGEQVFRFRRFRANVSADKNAAAFHAELDTTSLEGGMPGMASFARTRLLEVDTYPRAIFDGTARRVGDSEACVVEGTLTLHGVTRELRFDGNVHEERDALRFQATFDMPRKAFDVRLRNALDAFVPDDVRVVLDVQAQREHVVVE